MSQRLGKQARRQVSKEEKKESERHGERKIGKNGEKRKKQKETDEWMNLRDEEE